MPELPEVHIMVSGLDKAVSGKKIIGLWTEWPKYFKYPEGEPAFTRNILRKKIVGVERLGKNILFRLSGGYLMLVHQKMTGRFLIGRWRGEMTKENFKSGTDDPKDKFARLILFLEGGWALSFVDMRKFGKFLSGRESEILGMPGVRDVGLDPFSPDFKFETFRKMLKTRRVAVKKFLLDQKFVSGIGNIYADEMLWYAKINPLKKSNSLSSAEARVLFGALKIILKKSIRLGGSSISDYRDLFGRKGRYQKNFFVYGKNGERCSRCGASIKRIKIGTRSAHFCPKCQKI
ncbi:DNA-formamidopyrimidine glycosylase [Patescibacteria group bacterium]|nr:DNA-formamidopyrimidine glycosylase [Patescibacteria group bacterium]